MSDTPDTASADTVAHASVRPLQSLDLLSQREMESLASANRDLHELFRRCALAVLNTGGDTDDAYAVYARYSDFDLRVVPESRGLKLELFNAPAQAFVDGRMIVGIRNHLFAALRDIVFTQHKLENHLAFDLRSAAGITDAVFRILRNANIVRSDLPPKLVVCWGGHAISREEYDFSKQVGYQLGLRGLDIATGCGPGAMKGPMKGAAIGHAKQDTRDSRYVGITEPGIIAAESPNAIVNELVILPDIEKRLEAFVRLAHGIVVFPGGVGTLEEILFLLGVKTHPDNAGMLLPLIFAAPACSAGYFEEIDAFLRRTLGEEISRHYEIIVGDPQETARRMKSALREVRRQRVKRRESFSYQWNLHLPEALQKPFTPDHASMAALRLDAAQPRHALLVALRCAFSGIVAGNVKDFGVQAVAAKGPFQLYGDPLIGDALERLLSGIVAQGRMKLDAASYRPCFELKRRDAA